MNACRTIREDHGYATLSRASAAEIKTAELAETLRTTIAGTRSAETNWLGIKI